MNRLKNTLSYYRQTKSIQFNPFQANNIKSSSTTNTHSLQGNQMLFWIHTKLHHFIRKDLLKECLQYSYSFEEYRSLHHHYLPKKEQQTTFKEDIVKLPLTSGTVQSILLSQGFSNYPHYYSDLNKPAGSIINKIKAMKKKESLFNLKDTPYHIVKKLGEGGFASVYLVQDLSQQRCFYALKIQQPPHPWEFFILSQLQPLEDFILPVFACQHYADATFLFMQHLPYGTLLDFFNRYRRHFKTSCLPEPIALLFTWKLLEQLLVLHQDYRISHNDFKLDNIMIKPPSTLSSVQDLNQAMPKLILIDFGQSIYTPVLSHLQHNTPCRATWINDVSTDYPLFQTSFLPFHADYWQLAVAVHLLLFGTPMKYNKNTSSFKIQQTIKRYWHKSLWTHFFHIMLNAHQCTPQEIQNVASDMHHASLSLFQENTRILQPLYSIITTDSNS